MDHNKKIIIIIAVIVLGLAAVWFASKNWDMSGLDVTLLQYTSIGEFENMSTSDEIAAIEQDLNNTDFSDLGAELNSIEKEFNSGLAE